MFDASTMLGLAPLKRWTAWLSAHYCIAVTVVLVIHVGTMWTRAYLRQCPSRERADVWSDQQFEAMYPMCINEKNDARYQDGAHYTYGDLSWEVWLLMAALPVGGVVWGSILNSADWKVYRRYLQFLRLQFDTRLGMHSPR